MQKWEYAAITNVHNHSITSGRATGWEHFTHLTASGPQVTELSDDNKSLSQLIAKLGVEGWEMVGCGNTGESHHTVYFKRQI